MVVVEGEGEEDEGVVVVNFSTDCGVLRLRMRVKTSKHHQ